MTANSLRHNGRGGIRTHGTLLTYTHFPGASGRGRIKTPCPHFIGGSAIYVAIDPFDVCMCPDPMDSRMDSNSPVALPESENVAATSCSQSRPNILLNSDYPLEGYRASVPILSNINIVVCQEKVTPKLTPECPVVRGPPFHSWTIGGRRSNITTEKRANISSHSVDGQGSQRSTPQENPIRASQMPRLWKLEGLRSRGSASDSA